MGDLAKEYFRSKLNEAMSMLDFNNWVIRDFLLDLLIWQLDARSERSVFSPRKECAVGTRILGADSCPEVLDILGKRILFIVGVFPEHLAATGKRTVGLGYYVRMERTLARRLAHHYEPWKMVDRHFLETVKSLNYIRLSATIPKPKKELYYELQQHLKDCKPIL